MFGIDEREQPGKQRERRHSGHDPPHRLVEPEPRPEGEAARDLGQRRADICECRHRCTVAGSRRSEEHTSELQSLMRISYAVLYLKQKNTTRLQPPYFQPTI